MVGLKKINQLPFDLMMISDVKSIVHVNDKPNGD